MADNTRSNYRIKLNVEGFPEAQQSIHSINEGLRELTKLEKQLNSETSAKGGRVGNFDEMQEYVNKIRQTQRQIYAEAAQLNRQFELQQRQAIQKGSSVGAGRHKQIEDLRRAFDTQFSTTSHDIQKGLRNKEQEAMRQGQLHYAGTATIAPSNLRSHTPEVTSFERQLDDFRRTEKHISSNLNEYSRIYKSAVRTGEIGSTDAKRFRSLTESLKSFTPEDVKAQVAKDAENKTLDDYEETTKSFRPDGSLYSAMQKVYMQRQLAEMTEAKQIDEVNLRQRTVDTLTGKHEEMLLGGASDSELQNMTDAIIAEKELLDKSAKELREMSKHLEAVKNAIVRLEGDFSDTRDIQEALGDKEGPKIRERYDRDTMQGRFRERAFAISLATILAGVYSVKQSYSSGMTQWDQMGDTSISLGNRLGVYDYSALRTDYMREGISSGATGQEMLQFANAIAGSKGNVAPDDLASMSQGMSEFSKFSGVDSTSVMGLMSTLFRDSQLSSDTDIGAIQNAIIGGIQQSGMAGREEEQIAALESILQETIRGRNVTSEELKRQIALANIISERGGRSFQGQNLQNFMGTMNDAIKNADPFSTAGMLMGVGTDPRYSGPDGLIQFMKDREKGANPENLSRMMGNAYSVSGGNAERATAMMLLTNPGLDIGFEALQELFEKTNGGQFSPEEIAAEMARTEALGAETLEAGAEGYAGSSDALKDSKELHGAIRDLIVADGELAGELRKVGESINKWGSQNEGQAYMTFGAQALSTMIGGVMSSILSTASVHMLSPLFTKGFSAAAGGGGAGVLSNLLTGAGGMISSMNPAILKGAGLAGLGVMAVKDGVDVFNAEDKWETGGEKVGKWAGMAAGWKMGTGFAMKGAALGSALGPLGTILGGLGGLGLGMLGGHLGGKVGGWLGDKFGGGSKEQEVMREVKGAQVQGFNESAVANQKANTASKEGDNLTYEQDLIRQRELQISQIDKLLTRAAAQNGIVGVLSNTVSGQRSSGGGSGGSLNYMGNGEYWTNNDIRQHDLATTTSALTAEELNAWINSNASEDSTMYNMGAAFLEAGKQSGLDPRYLVAHAALETGWGTSQYSRAGNFYGIGAFDNNPDNALNYGHDSPWNGIVGGAKWISDNYYQRGQTTLSSMHRDPTGGGHNYATDPEWANKIAATMRGSEGYVNPTVNVNTTVNYSGGGGPDAVANAVSTRVSQVIPSVFTREYTRLMS